MSFVTRLSEFVSLVNAEKESSDKAKEIPEEAENPVPESPIPELPPRAQGTGVSMLWACSVSEEAFSKGLRNVAQILLCT